MSPVQPFIANSSPGRLLLLCLLSLGFVAVGVWLAMESDPGSLIATVRRFAPPSLWI